MRPLGLLLVFLVVVAGCSGESEDAGFAGLASPGKTGQQLAFLQPGPGDRVHLPEDLGPHPRHRIEWWYLTANLETSDGRPLGVQWTQFRQAIQPRAVSEVPPLPSQWPLQAAWMAHAAISLDGQHRFAEKLARGDVGHAGAVAEPLHVWLDNWQLRQQDAGSWRLRVESSDWSYDLLLHINGDPVAHGDHGFSAKSASGEGSMYFSLVDIAIEGTVTMRGEAVAVKGRGWFDREWSSQFLKAGQQGWDWFALHLDSGDKLMAFQLRNKGDVFQSGTWIPASGPPKMLNASDLTLTPLAFSGKTPTGWRLQLPDYQVDINVAAPAGNYRNSGLYAYWESPVSVSGSHSGEGYMELTGYDDD
ncbi:carotenoid 1,2-hydratase [Marinobacter sediminum]|uniref:lipocalin-like domain-containing protein n=1 Tax=Marinobacter sediminum TaxID=256323 RepID=UPI00202EB191|nr:lipocalin-like domain-containing protein [Marinobacter sediminum]MCM0614137.1 carotenoid 1,2-hydratase [Marinobacter sediminum]